MVFRESCCTLAHWPDCSGVYADITLSNFARSFGSAIKLRLNVTSSLYNIKFSENTIISEPNAPDKVDQIGPDLYVGSTSSALLNNVTFTEVAPEEDGASRKDLARIAVQSATSSVYARSAGGDGQDGQASGGQENGADVYVKESQSLTTTQPLPAAKAPLYPSTSDPSYIDIMKVCSFH